MVPNAYLRWVQHTDRGFGAIFSTVHVHGYRSGGFMLGDKIVVGSRPYAVNRAKTFVVQLIVRGTVHIGSSGGYENHSVL